MINLEISKTVTQCLMKSRNDAFSTLAKVNIGSRGVDFCIYTFCDKSQIFQRCFNSAALARSYRKLSFSLFLNTIENNSTLEYAGTDASLHLTRRKCVHSFHHCACAIISEPVHGRGSVELQLLTLCLWIERWLAVLITSI